MPRVAFEAAVQLGDTRIIRIAVAVAELQQPVIAGPYGVSQAQIRRWKPPSIALRLHTLGIVKAGGIAEDCKIHQHGGAVLADGHYGAAVFVDHRIPAKLQAAAGHKVDFRVRLIGPLLIIDKYQDGLCVFFPVEYLVRHRLHTVAQ